MVGHVEYVNLKAKVPFIPEGTLCFRYWYWAPCRTKPSLNSPEFTKIHMNSVPVKNDPQPPANKGSAVDATVAAADLLGQQE